jgi:hypothetical protein
MRKIRLLTIFILACIVVVHLGCMSSQSPANGGLSGIVTDSSGNPLSGVKVSTPEASTLTSTSGKWTLDSLSAQIFEVTAFRENYQSQTKTVEVLSGQTIENVNFSLAADSEIYDIVVSNLTSSQVTITYYSKKQAQAYIKYGINNLLENKTPRQTDETFMHQFTISNLTPASTYNFICVAEDTAGRVIESANKNFTTLYTQRGDPPTGLAISKLSDSNVIRLNWNTNTQADFAGYKVYRAESAEGPFLEIGQVSQNGYSDMNVEPGKKYYYRVTRLSGSSEESSASNVESLVMPGIMNTNTVWTAQNSPYLLTGDLHIAPGVSLVIDKGVSIGVSKLDQWDKETSDDKIELKVQGTLMVQGTSDQPVSFTSVSSSPQAGDWQGIIFDVNADLSTSLIKGLNLSCATKGINGLAGLPAIQASRIFNCSASGIESKDARQKVVISSVTIDTCGTGINIINNPTADAKISSSKVLRCIHSIVCRDNQNVEISDNHIYLSGVTGIDVGNTGSTSITTRNVVGYGSNGSAIICRGKDEIRRNTLQANIGIEIKDDARAVLRSNLILADDTRSSIGVLYSSPNAYAPASHTIQNNVIWDIPTGNSRRYANSDGTALSGISSDQRLNPSLQGGNPFVEIPAESFLYIPSAGSSLKGAGFDSETVGAYDVPD